MEIKTIKNYKDLANKFKEITKCDEVKIKIMNSNDHYHFGMIKDGLPIATICYDEGELSVSPFTDIDENSDCWINVNKFPIFDDFTVLMNALRDLVVETIV